MIVVFKVLFGHKYAEDDRWYLTDGLQHHEARRDEVPISHALLKEQE